MSYATFLNPSITADLAWQETQASARPAAGGREEKLRKYAAEFEADLLANLYKDMQHSLGDTPDQDPGSDTLSDMGVHALTAGIVAGGGIGIAKLLIQHLLPYATASGNTKPPV